MVQKAESAQQHKNKHIDGTLAFHIGSSLGCTGCPQQPYIVILLKFWHPEISFTLAKRAVFYQYPFQS